MKPCAVIFVMAMLMAGCEDGVTPLLNDQKVKLLAPGNKVVSRDTAQTFYWEELQDSLRYQLQIVSPRFDSIVRMEADTILERNRLTLKLRPDAYEWRVRALGVGTASKYSDAFRLTIQ